MSDKPPKPDHEKEAERRFKETLGRMLETPPKPHKGSKPTPTPKPKG